VKTSGLDSSASQGPGRDARGPKKWWCLWRNRKKNIGKYVEKYMNSPISYGFLTVFHFLSARFFNFFSESLILPNWGNSENYPLVIWDYPTGDYGIRWYDLIVFFIGFHGMIFHEFPSGNLSQFANWKITI
jgi:hypothetical protein